MHLSLKEIQSWLKTGQVVIQKCLSRKKSTESIILNPFICISGVLIHLCKSHLTTFKLNELKQGREKPLLSGLFNYWMKEGTAEPPSLPFNDDMIWKVCCKVMWQTHTGLQTIGTSFLHSHLKDPQKWTSVSR